MSTFTPGLFIFTTVHANGDEARQMSAERLGRQYAQDFSKLVNKYALAGTPEECRKRLQEYIDAGTRTVLLPAACRPEYADENLRLLAKEVIPAFR
jgi:alkanesulfonate monooxygenase SsuD/methylene tetrahydromethanopterin reductase-like flavin-dependent oxidoreductase (luciferase family)